MAGSFQFDGKEIPFVEGDTVASALHRAGVRAISRSMKYHRPRGLFCVAGSCASCFVAVDGIPNVPTCTRVASDGAEVVSQNRVGSARRDLLSVVDVVYPDGFDPHDAFTSPGFVNRLFVRSVRSMSGWGKAPAVGARLEGPRRHTHAVDELIVGGGRLGLQRAASLAGSGQRVVLVEEEPALGGSSRFDPADTLTRDLVGQAPGWMGVSCWSDALAFGIYAGVVAVRRGDDLHEVTATRITIAPGRHDAVPVFTNNDLPGVLSLRGAQRLWYGHGVLPGRKIVVHGQAIPDRFEADLIAAGADFVAHGAVDAVAGGTTVERVRIGDAWHKADTVVSVLQGVPRVELFQQAGCRLTWDHGVAPVVGPDGATTVPAVLARFSAFDNEGAEGHGGGPPPEVAA